jgi:hypothetical protein
MGGSPMFRSDIRTLGSNALHSVDKLDYAIRRWAIPDHPSRTTQPLMRTDARLNELQRAIGRYLRAQYEVVLPMPDQLVALLRQIEQPA